MHPAPQLYGARLYVGCTSSIPLLWAPLSQALRPSRALDPGLSMSPCVLCARCVVWTCSPAVGSSLLAFLGEHMRSQR